MANAKQVKPAPAKGQAQNPDRCVCGHPRTDHYNRQGVCMRGYCHCHGFTVPVNLKR